MTENRPLNIPLILGTTRKGRMSENAARFMVGQIEKRNGIKTELIDIAKLPMPWMMPETASKTRGFPKRWRWPMRW
jgi:NAD(P)H-dependent FMN reductase